MEYEILLYYKFTPIANPTELRDEHEAKCRELNLKGRILIATEGINGTVSGLKADIAQYKQWMQQHPVYAGVEFKCDEHDKHAFLKLHVRVKNEIVRFNMPNLVEQYGTSPYIEPEEFRKVLKEAETNPNIVILDARSKHEYEVGRFKNAIGIDIEKFRELSDHEAELEKLRGKKVYTYCTGGIKCEKISGWLQKVVGIEELYQLHGGIARYAKEAQGENFDGECYVFDQRVVVPVNQVNPTSIGHCYICGDDTSKMMNCANAECNNHVLVCEKCFHEYDGCCCTTCMEAPKRRAFNEQGYFLRGVNSKIYVNE